MSLKILISNSSHTDKCECKIILSLWTLTQPNLSVSTKSIICEQQKDSRNKMSILDTDICMCWLFFNVVDFLEWQQSLHYISSAIHWQQGEQTATPGHEVNLILSTVESRGNTHTYTLR